MEQVPSRKTKMRKKTRPGHASAEQKMRKMQTAAQNAIVNL
jgi:hypothetical protein